MPLCVYIYDCTHVCVLYRERVHVRHGSFFIRATRQKSVLFNCILLLENFCIVDGSCNRLVLAYVCGLWICIRLRQFSLEFYSFLLRDVVIMVTGLFYVVRFASSLVSWLQSLCGTPHHSPVCC